MKKIRIATLLSFLLMLCSNLSAQTTEDKIVEPQFPGGRKELLKYMEKNMVSMPIRWTMCWVGTA